MQRLFIDRFNRQPNAKEWAFIIESLSAPFENLKFRQQAGSNYAAYADAREYYERFDRVVGPDNWQTSYETMSMVNTQETDITPEDAPKNRWGKVDKEHKKFSYRDETLSGIKCTISVFGVAKADVGTPSKAEEVKGAFSDSFKRAAVQWGPGRYIYALGYFNSAKPRLPEEAQFVDFYDYDSMILEQLPAKILAKAEGLDLTDLAKANIEAAKEDYDVNVSLLQKYRVFQALMQIGKNLGTDTNYGYLYGGVHSTENVIGTPLPSILGGK